MEPLELIIDEAGTLLNENLSTTLKITSGVDENTALAILNDDAISTITLPFVSAEGSVSAEPKGGEQKIQLAENNELTIDGKADAGLRLGLFDTIEDLETDLFNTDAMKVTVPTLKEGEVYALFSMSYGISAEASGEWVFTQGKVNAGFEGDTSKRQAVIRKYKKTTGVRKALVETIGSLRAANKLVGPGNNSKQLPNQTTLLVKTEGSFKGDLGVSAGYDFNWIYESKARGLEGSIGVKSKLAGSLAMNFGLSGTFVLGVSNLGGEVLRLKTFRQRAKGWGFAADLSATIQGDFSDVEKERSADEILKAAFGLQHSQVFDDLKKIRDLVDPEELQKKVAGFSDDILKELTTGKLGNEFKNRRDELIRLLDKWDELGADAGAQLWKLLDDQSEGKLGELRDEVKELAAKSDEEIEQFLKEKYADIGFAETTLGKLIDDLIPEEDIIDVLIQSELLNTLKEKIKKLNDLLSLEDQIEKLHAGITERIGIKKVRELVEKADPEKLGTWLKAKLEDVTETVIDELKLEEVDDFIDKVSEKAGEIAEAIKKALNEEYGVSLAIKYQKDSENTALIDADFNFSANTAQVERVFRDTVKGDYNGILKSRISGVSLNRGILTSKIKRQSSISITLPFARNRFEHLNQSLAKGEFVDQQGGRLAMFSLEALDRRSSRRRMSEIGVGLLYEMLAELNGEDVVRKKSIDMKYNFRLAKDNLKKGHLDQIVVPFVNFYVHEAFENKSTVPKESPKAWLNRLQDIVQERDGIRDNDKFFGDTLLRVSVNVPGDAGKAWFNVPEGFGNPVYLKIAAAVQARLKTMISTYFLDNDDELRYLETSYDKLLSILIYKNVGHIDIIKKITDKGDVRNKAGRINKVLVGLMRSPEFSQRLYEDIRVLRERFKTDDVRTIRMLGEKIETIDDQVLLKVIHDLKALEGPLLPYIKRLLRVEKMALEGVFKSSKLMVEFRKGVKSSSKQDIQKVIDRLRDFGSELSEAFNSIKVRDIAARADYTRFIGPEIFLTVAQVLDSTVSDNTTGALQLIALKPDSGFDPEDFLGGQVPEADDVILSQLIVDAD